MARDRRRRQRGAIEETVPKDTGTSTDSKETRRTRRKKEVTEKVYDMIKPELLARVDDIIASERGMKYYIKTEGWQHLSEHYIHAGDVPKFRAELERCLNDECYIDLDRTDVKYSRIVDICKY